MKTIGQIAYLMLTKCEKEHIAASMCQCLEEMYIANLISEEEKILFSAVICGWQAVGDNAKHISRIQSNLGPVHYIDGEQVQEDFAVYIRVDYERKRQWLINLACLRS